MQLKTGEASNQFRLHAEDAFGGLPLRDDCVRPGESSVGGGDRAGAPARGIGVREAGEGSGGRLVVVEVRVGGGVRELALIV